MLRPGISFDPKVDSFMEQNFKLAYSHPAVRDAVRAVLCRPDWLVKCLSDVDLFRCCWFVCFKCPAEIWQFNSLKFDFEKWQSLQVASCQNFQFPSSPGCPARVGSTEHLQWWSSSMWCFGCLACNKSFMVHGWWYCTQWQKFRKQDLPCFSTPSVNSWWGPSHRGGLVRHEKELARACLEVDEMDRGSQPMFCDSLLHWFDTLRCQFSTSPLLHWFSDVSFQHLHCFIDSQMSVFNISIDVNVSNFKFTQHSEVSCDSVSSWCKLPPVALVQGTSSSMHSCQGKSPKCAAWLRCADAHSQPSARCIARINLACSSCLANINIVLFCVSSQHPAWILISGMMNAMSSAMKQPAANPATQWNLLWSGSLKMWWRRSLRQRRAAKFNS